jgi:CRP/FNR family transcriptional regulator
MNITPADLARLPPFSGLDERVRQQLAQSFVIRECTAGQVLALEGEPCVQVHFVARGALRMRQFTLEGREHLLSRLGPGTSPDLIPALDGLANLATVDALGDTVLYAIPRERFLALLAQDSGLAVAVARHLASEGRRLTLMVKGLALYSVRARLARFLLAEAEANPSRRRWTQEMIAAQIGTVRDVVGRALRAFADEGLIRRERGRLVVADREALQREAGD